MSQSEYQTLLKEALMKNEANESQAYKLSHAESGNSGWTFGYNQMDIGNNSEARSLIQDILNHEYGSGYYESVESSLTAIRNSNSISQSTRSAIDYALNSSYGRSLINQSFDSHLQQSENYINNLELRLGIQLTLGAKVSLGDLNNQLPIQQNGSTESLLRDAASDDGIVTLEEVNSIRKTYGWYQTTVGKTDFDRRMGNIKDVIGTYEAKQSLTTTLETVTVIAEKEAAAKSWFETFSDSLGEWVGSVTNFIKEAASDVIDFFSSVGESISKIGSWVSNAFTGGQSEQIPDHSQINNSLLNLTINTSEDSNNANADPNTFVNGTVKSGGDYSIDMPSDVLNEDGLNNQEASKVTSDQIRPGAQTLTQNDTSGWLDRTANFLQETIVQPIADLGSSVWSGIQSAFSSITNLFSAAPKVQNVDPLVLDLNGNGVELIAFKDSKVSFDVDNDNYKENTGWVKGTDGILVEDKNHDGKINDITETISEHYTNNVADGLEALKTLDSNHDNIFNNQDAKWNDLKVWVDANEDGVTDAGELKTLDELNIQSIDLNRTIAYRERIEGNPVLSRSTYTTTDGQTHEAAAVDFTTNPIGYEWNDAYEQGAKISAQDSSSSSFVITDVNGATINLAEKGVNSGYGNIGNDTIIGDANNNWLMGGKGSDSLKAGAGDDIIMIDADDKNENIDGGDGLDVIKVIDDRSVVFNMTMSNAEVINSGAGDDILIGGGASNVFISGGAGDDIIIGGAADDALSGEDGEDYIDGGYGDDVIRGHRGNDVLIGGEGNDYMEGGLGDDRLLGGVGNDVLIGNEGNDEIDGGDGFDMMEYVGKYDQYTFNRSADGTVTVTDTADGSVDTIKNVERLRFDHVDVNISGSGTALPLPVKDNITVSGSGAFEIDQAQILANDFSTSGKSFSVRSVSDAVGGTVALRADGKIIFTPDQNFIGTMSFDYSVIDSDGNYATISRKKSDGTVESADLRAQVNLTNTSDPSDPLYFDQWYLSEIKVKLVWEDYSGKGVNIGVFEGDYGNPLNYKHADLQNNISSDYLNDVLIEDDVTSYSNHATLVAGVIAAEKNGQGSIGIAYDATLASLSWDSSTNGLGKLMDYDVANNSWMTVAAFGDNFTKDYGDNVAIAERARAMQNAAELGRDGLGTSVIFAGGNNRQKGDNVNYHNTQNSRHVITTGSINQEGDLSKLVDASQPFSNPGSAILVSAPGSNIKSTANLLQNSNGSTFGSDFESTQGTSFSAPIVSGIVALMLEANPNLGYRDIQLILARTAKKIEDQNTVWKNNGDNNWNGGEGMHYSEDYGFGIVDAHAAVRMAESWTQINNSLNEQSLVTANNNAINITDNGSITSTINVSNSSINPEHVEVYVDIDHSRIGDLVLTLISPDGTESVLVNRPDKPLGSDDTNYGSTQNGLKFTLSSTHYLGETGNGNWVLKVEDKASGVSGVLNNWDLKFYGSSKTNDDSYTFTKEFGGNKTISDTSGTDSIDATGILTDSVIDLRAGNTSILGGKNLAIAAGSIIENAYSGDGNDTLIGNEANNILYAGRGNNKLTGNDGSDKFIIFKNENQIDRIADFNASDTNEKIDLTRFKFASFSDLTIAQNGANAEINLGDGQKLILENLSASALSADNFSGFLNEAQTLNGASGNDNLYGDDRDTTILAGAGDDYINGGKGNNTITGGNGEDVFFIEVNPNKTDIITDFDLGNLLGFENEERISLRNFKNVKNIDDLALSQQGLDAVITLDNDQKIILQNINKNDLTNNNFIFFNQIVGTDGIDKMIGSDLPDIMSGSDGNDILRGLEWNDDISGGKGNDEIGGDHGDDILRGEFGKDLIFGGVGADTIYGGQDNDTLFGGNNSNPATFSDNKSNTIYGESGSDIVYGDAGADKLYGGYGDDDISGLDGDDEIYGEENNDTIYGGGGNDKIYGGDNNDTIYAGSGNDQINGGAGDDRIEGIEGDNLIYGDEGNDLIFGGTGIDRIHGGIGNDTIVGESDNSTSIGSGDFLYGDEGNDILLGAANDDEIYGGDGNDILQGDLGNDKLFGDAGNDVLRGNQGDNEYTGGDGNDIFVITDNPNGTDTINDFEVSNPNEKINLLNLTNILDFSQLVLTQSGNDTLIEFGDNQKIILKNVNKSQINRNHFITSNHAPEVVNEPSQKDSFINTPFSFDIQNSFYDSDGDSLTYTAKLSDGSDLPSWINFNPSTLTFSGTATSSAYSAVIVVTATDSKGASVSLSFDFKTNSGVVINGTPGNDFSVGTAGNDYITGAGGNDYLFGGAGNDIVSGDEGNDNIRGDVDASYNPSTGIISTSNYDTNIGNDTLYGNGGNDTILGDRGNDKIYGGSGDDILLGCEGNDELYAGEGDDQIAGGIDSDPNVADSDGDKIYGEDGNDTIWGANGDDIVYGGSGNDYIYGNKGNDVIHDGSGKDIVYGGEGNDIIYLEGGNQLTTFGGSIDTVFLGESGNDTFIVSKDISSLAGTGILNDIIYDFEVNNPNEKIDLTAFKNIRDISDLRFSNVNLNGAQFIRVYVAGQESNQYISLKGVTQDQLQNSNFIFFADNAPTAASDSFTIDEDSSAVIKVTDLIRNDSDSEDGSPIFYQISSQPLHGSLVNNGNGNYSYIPSTNFNGSDSFSYQVKDSNGAIRSGVVTININPVNDTPTASLTSATTNEDNSITIDVLVSASDIDNDALSISSVSTASQGVVSIVVAADGKQKIVYTPNNNYSGIDSFSYTISDGNGGLVTKTLAVTINAVNDAPILLSAVNDKAVFVETSFNFSVNNLFVDVEGEQISYVATLADGSTLPSWLSFDSNNLLFSGKAPMGVEELSLKIIASDSSLESTAVNFKLIIDNNTMAGTDYDDNLSALKDGMSVIGGNGNDNLSAGNYTANLYGEAGNDILNGGNGNDLINGGDGNDIISGNSGNNILTGGNGSDIFIVQNSNLASINTINDFDLTKDKINLDQFNFYSLDALKVSQQGNDTVIEVSQLNKIILKNINFLDLSEENFIGFKPKFGTSESDSINSFSGEFYSKIYAGAGDDDIMMMRFTGKDTNSLYEYYGEDGKDSLQVYGVGKFRIDGGNNDDYFSAGTQNSELHGGSGNDIFYLNTIRSFNADGTSSIFGGNNKVYGDEGDDVLWIERDSNNNILNGGVGNDHFVIEKSQGGVNYIADFEENDKINLSLCDFENFQQLQISQVGEDASINLGNNQSLVLRNFSASLLNVDNFIFRTSGDAADNVMESEQNYLSVIEGEDGNDTLISNNKVGDTHLKGGSGNDIFVIENNPNSWTEISDFDPSNPNEKIQIAGFSDVRQFSDLNIFYSLANPEIGMPQYASIHLPSGQAIRISNVASNSLSASNFIFNSNPKLSDLATLVINEDNSLLIDILSNASDSDGDSLVISSVTNGAHGVASIVDDIDGKQKISYIPNTNYVGEDKITFSISDGNGGLVTKDLTLNITPTNDAPTITQSAESQLAYLGSAFTYQLPNNLFSDIDGDNLTISATLADGSPLPSWLSFNGSSFSGIAAGVIGNLSIMLTASDASGLTASQEFNINVTGENSAPIARNNSFILNEDKSINISFSTILSNDSDAEDGSNIKNLTKDNIIFTNPSHGNIVINNNAILYTPNKDFSGVDSLTYQIKDSAGVLSNAATISFNVKEVNDAPVIASDSFVVDEDSSISIKLSDLIANDSDADDNLSNLTLDNFIFSNPNEGTITKDFVNNAIIYTPNQNYNGSDSLTYQIFDSKDAFSARAVINLEVIAKNDAPIARDKIANQTSKAGNSFYYKIAGVPFSDLDQDILTYRAEMVDGSSLPSWLSFDSANKIFSGTPPFGDAFSLAIKVIGSDGIAEASQNFNININSNQISGNSQDNIINGTTINDKIYGNAGNDNIKAGMGNDLLIGGAGADLLMGGAGSDQFIFENLSDSTINENDLILDFISGQDKVNLSGLGFDNISTAGNNNSDHGLEYHFDGENTTISDPNSNFAVKLAGEIQLGASDFMF